MKRILRQQTHFPDVKLSREQKRDKIIGIYIKIIVEKKSKSVILKKKHRNLDS